MLVRNEDPLLTSWHPPDLVTAVGDNEPSDERFLFLSVSNKYIVI